MIKVAFVYKKDNYFLSGNHWDNIWYYFFMKALKRNTEIEVDYIDAGDSFDCKTLKHDILLSYSTHLKFSPHYRNIRECKTPSLFLSGDPHSFNMQKALINEYGLTNFFFMSGPKYFRQFFPKCCNYRQIILGLEPEVYFNGMERWHQRKEDKILNSGVIRAGPFYHLRKMVNQSQHVEYIGRDEGHIGVKYLHLLSQYRAAIAASTQCVTLRYLEVPSCGCLPFFEVTPQNEVSTFGYTDGLNAVFINEDNFDDRIEEYMRTHKDPKWHDIAKNAYNYVENNFTNDQGAARLVRFMKEIIDG